MPRRNGVCMMIIVPALAEGDHRHPEIVSRLVSRDKAPRSPGVRR